MVSVSLSGSSLTVTAVAAGTAAVTVTATDPDGLSATQSAEVTVVAGFRDDFDSAESLDKWELVEGRASVSDGLLRPYQHRRRSRMDAPSPGLLADVLDASCENVPGRGAWPGHPLRGIRATSGTLYSPFDIKDTSSGNYGLYMWDEEEEDWLKLEDQSGYSDAVRHGANEMTEITIAREEEELIGMAGDTELFRWRLNKTAATLFDELTGIELYYDSSSGGRSGLYDWVEAAGTQSGAAMPDVPVARPGTQSPRLGGGTPLTSPGVSRGRWASGCYRQPAHRG